MGGGPGDFANAALDPDLDGTERLKSFGCGFAPAGASTSRIGDLLCAAFMIGLLRIARRRAVRADAS